MKIPHIRAVSTRCIELARPTQWKLLNAAASSGSGLTERDKPGAIEKRHVR